jgi:8-hydroxy-5-deazaflavin:NADPH oxidoreductase
MRIGVLGTGTVGKVIGSALIAQGNQVRMGSRTADNPAASAWAADAGPDASHGTFADAAGFGALVFNCTSGVASLAALEAAGRENLKGKVLIDVANPLDFSKGMPPSLTVCNTDSLAEQIQRALPETRVVKTLNTMNCKIMVNPSLLPDEHNVFLSGNDVDAKKATAGWLGEWFGWRAENIIDLGDITTARGVEMLLPIWVRLYGKFGNADFNFRVTRAAPVVAGG